ncbi:transcriptional coactivator p15/PC4 family protein [bacterium]|nr:transcriptional coactivator p15/PC4 family protein [bacterium]
MIEIQKNQKEVYRIEEKEYSGYRFVDVRIWFMADDGDYKPSKKGISFSHDKAQDIIEAILKTIEDSNWKSFDTK